MLTENELGRLVLKLANTIIKNRNNHLECLNLTSGQADALQFFLGHDGATVADWRSHYDIAHQTASGIVKRLAEKELVYFTPSSKDRRSQTIHATDAGNALGKKMMANRERTGGKLLDGMSKEEQSLFMALLEKAYENIKED